jgi:predicted metal-dependent hydrolase
MSLTTVARESDRAAHRGAAREIAPRAIKFDFDAETPRHWLDGDPYLTNVMNALSLTFPEGERFFVAAVRHFRDRATDPTLERQVRGFLAQESLHRREHETLNAWLREQGFAVDKYYAEVVEMLAERGTLATPMVRLAVTCALEHFTAIMAELWLTRDDLRAQAHPSVRSLWTWHALEELDHKAVAFDVYKAADGGYTLRAAVMLFTSIQFVAKVASLHARLMKEDGELTNVKSWLRGIWRCWGPRGYFSSLIPAYLQYYRPSFHPWDKDDSALVTRFERELALTHDETRAG